MPLTAADGRYALLFPGQASQGVGMGRALAARFTAARAVFAEVDDALGFALSDIAWSGPEDRLTLTAHAQPAILAHSVAAWRTIAPQFAAVPVAALGHSLGEWSALVVAGAIPLAEAARLVHLRGQLMQAAVAPGAGQMAAVLGLDRAAIAEARRSAGSVFNEANARLQAGELGAAIAGYRTALELDPHDPRILANLGEARSKVIGSVGVPDPTPLERAGRL